MGLLGNHNIKVTILLFFLGLPRQWIPFGFGMSQVTQFHVIFRSC